jgi:hypothetical protein
MADLVNQLSWSYSRKRSLERCRRLYYYQYYLSWNGWKMEESYARRHAYRLKQMRSFATFAGDLVHERIKYALLQWKNTGIAVTAKESLEAASIEWNKALQESQSMRWIGEPKRFRCFLEDYYCDGNRQQKMEQAWECVHTCLVNFYNSKTWSQIRASRCENWLAWDSDPFTTASVDGIPMFGRPDFAYGRVRNGQTRGHAVCSTGRLASHEILIQTAAVLRALCRKHLGLRSN